MANKDVVEVPLPFDIREPLDCDRQRRSSRARREDSIMHVERDDVGLGSWSTDEVDSLVRALRNGSLVPELAFWLTE